MEDPNTPRCRCGDAVATPQRTGCPVPDIFACTKYKPSAGALKHLSEKAQKAAAATDQLFTPNDVADCCAGCVVKFVTSITAPRCAWDLGKSSAAVLLTACSQLTCFSLSSKELSVARTEQSQLQLRKSRLYIATTWLNYPRWPTSTLPCKSTS